MYEKYGPISDLLSPAAKRKLVEYRQTQVEKITVEERSRQYLLALKPGLERTNELMGRALSAREPVSDAGRRKRQEERDLLVTQQAALAWLEGDDSEEARLAAADVIETKAELLIAMASENMGLDRFVLPGGFPDQPSTDEQTFLRQAGEQTMDVDEIHGIVAQLRQQQ
ncbi:hypothetical protein KJ608_00510 [Patescibacteria group bacterium]|nr:hypothetical protein [Patescibacteria group bacterium]